jgi:TRAP-type C4-dicarboxylate transport system substrate-binding protein
MQSSRRRLVTAGIAAGASLALPGVGRAQAAREFKIGLITGPSHYWTQTMQAFGESLKKESGGRLSAAVFPAGQLGNEPTMIQQMQSGALDMGFLTAAEFSNRIANFGAFFAPYLTRDVSHAARLLRGKEAQGMLDSISELGMVGLGYGLGGMRHVLSRSPAATAADLKGKKFRITPFAPLRDFYNFVGIAPTPIPLPGLFDALANGQIDGADVDLELVWNLKLYQQARHLIVTHHMMFPVVAVMSGKVFAGLPAPDRQLIRKVLDVELDKLFARYAQSEGEWLKQIQGTGIDVKSPGSAFFGDVTARWEQQWAPQAPSLARLRAEAA